MIYTTIFASIALDGAALYYKSTDIKERIYTSTKTFRKNVQICMGGNAKNHRTRCRYGSMQARQG